MVSLEREGQREERGDSPWMLREAIQIIMSVVFYARSQLPTTMANIVTRYLLQPLLGCKSWQTTIRYNCLSYLLRYSYICTRVRLNQVKFDSGITNLFVKRFILTNIQRLQRISERHCIFNSIYIVIS